MPEPMIGTRLRPLSALAELAPDEYERHLRKYADHPGRERLPSRYIPRLDCRWQDVVQLAPIDPQRIREAWSELGVRLRPDVRFFRFPAEALSDMSVVVYHPREDVGPADPVDPAQVEWFDAGTYHELGTIPARTKAWYRTLADQGRTGAFFHGMPHVMVRGELEVGLASVVTWSGVPDTAEC